jgi:hypothetical protein
MERSFIEILDDLSDGDVSLRLTDELRRCVNGARRADKSAKLTLTLTIEPDDRLFVVTAKIKADIPTPGTSMTALYATEEGELRKEDPRQQQLKHVPVKPTGPLRTVGGSLQPEAKQE